PLPACSPLSLHDALPIFAPDTTSPESGRWALGGRVSIGERLFLTDRFMVRIAASELVYSGRVRGRAEIERKLTIEGGVAWLFGGDRKSTRLNSSHVSIS